MWTARAAVLLVALIVAPVTVLALVPTVFGLERYVMTSDVMGGSLSRGSLMFDRIVPASDVEVGDVVSYRPPPSAEMDFFITRRVADVGDGYMQTQADTHSEPDPWWVQQSDYPAISRMVIGVPYIGYVSLWAEGRSTWNLVLIGAGSLLLVVLARDRWGSRPRRSEHAEAVGV
ncbi:hypothetical protein GCM10027020_16380 [Nocardioides salsibiostraticola]